MSKENEKPPVEASDSGSSETVETVEKKKAEPKYKFDPKRITFGTVLTKDVDEKGFVKLKDGQPDNWISGKVRIEVIDLGDGRVLDYKDLELTKTKYEAFREDFDDMSNEERLKNYF